MPKEEKKPISTGLPLSKYNRFIALGDRLGYSATNFGEILLCFALPNWEEAVKQRVAEVKAEEPE